MMQPHKKGYEASLEEIKRALTGSYAEDNAKAIANLLDASNVNLPPERLERLLVGATPTGDEKGVITILANRLAADRMAK